MCAFLFRLDWSLRKLRKEYGGGHRGVEALAGAANVGYRYAVAHKALHLWRYASRLVAYHQRGRDLQRGAKHIAAVEQGTIDGVLVGRKPLAEVGLLDAGAEYAAHSGLHNLGIVATHGVGAAHDVAHAEPVGGANDGAQIAGVLYAVEHHDKAFLLRGCQGAPLYEHPHLVGTAHGAKAFQFGVGDLVALHVGKPRLMGPQPFGHGANHPHGHARGKSLLGHLDAFDDKKAVGVATLLLLIDRELFEPRF